MSSCNESKNIQREAIFHALPHRPPFLFLDRILACEPGVYAKATMVLQEDAAFLAGHFPAFPVMPGVLLLEMMAQTACFALAGATAKGSLYLLAKVETASFSRQVRPGDEICTEARLTRKVEQFYSFSCGTSCEGQRVAKASLLVACKN